MRLLFCLLLCAATTAVHAGRIYSFVNEKGVRVFTNEPSRRPDLSLPGESSTKTPAATSREERYRPLIREAAEQFGIDEKLVEAIIAVESNFNPKAVSTKDCKGLMQLHPETARRFGVENVFDPAENIEGGVKYLQFLMQRFDNNLTHVVAAYNAGEHAVERHSGIPPFKETRQYVKKVGRLYDLTGRAPETERPQPARRVFRLTLPDGRVLYTNTPSIASKK